MNRLTGFMFENHVAHGALVELTAGVDEMIGQRDYGGDVRRLLGEAMAAMPLLATHLRFEGRINLQFQSSGPLKLLVAQIDHHLSLRAMAKAPAALAGGFAELLAGGVLALMLEPNNVPGGPQRQATQALVPIQGDSLAQALEAYFEQSEQLPTVIRIGTGAGRLCGFILQRLPLQHAQASQEDWHRLQALAGTLHGAELLREPAQVLLARVFGGEALRVFEPREVAVSCRCSRAGISRLLLALGREEVDSILAEQGRVEVTCEFCGRRYEYRGAEATELFAAAGSTPPQTRH
ncbi:MAG: Hsp33 family molecular chaperone HslO [Nevskia sp.]|nr:Hsp33 family molecular chaperone HslO [Nevskia sp.]